MIPEDINLLLREMVQLLTAIDKSLGQLSSQMDINNRYLEEVVERLRRLD
jgi:hypothetical protein